jgi:hypothetical protein
VSISKGSVPGPSEAQPMGKVSRNEGPGTGQCIGTPGHASMACDISDGMILKAGLTALSDGEELA